MKTMPETTVRFVIQRCGLKINGEVGARGWCDWNTPTTNEAVGRNALARIQETELRLAMGGKPISLWRLVRIEERREVVE